MTAAYNVSLACAVVAVWLATLAFFRLSTPLQRIHVVTFVNIFGGGLIVLAAFLSDGLSSRSLKCLLICFAAVAFGSLLAQVTGRALHLRDGERR
jgi:multicomponent Na+:H+ antiporter subunit G